MVLLKNCLFCGETLIIVSSLESNDGHAHAECIECNYAFRYLDIPTIEFSLIIAEKLSNEALKQ